MIKRIAKSFFQILFLLLLTIGLFAWQGGWWYVRPTHEWSQDFVDKYNRWYFVDFVDNGASMVFARSSVGSTDNPNRVTRFLEGFRLVDTKTGNVLFERRAEKEQRDLGYYFDRRSKLCYELDLGTRSFVVVDVARKSVQRKTLSGEILKGVYCLSVSEDGQWLYCLDDDHTLWNCSLETAEMRRTGKLDIGGPWEEFAMDSQRCCVMVGDKKVIAFDLSNGKKIWEREFEHSRIAFVQMHGAHPFLSVRVEHRERDMEDEEPFDASDLLLDAATGKELFAAQFVRPKIESDDDRANSDPNRIIEARPLGQRTYDWPCVRVTKDYLLWDPQTVLSPMPEFHRTEINSGFATKKIVLGGNFKGRHFSELIELQPDLYCMHGKENIRPMQLAPADEERSLKKWFLETYDRLMEWSNPPKREYIFFDPNNPTETRWSMYEPCTVPSYAVHCPEGHYLLTLAANQEQSRSVVRIYNFPIRTYWYVRLGIALLPALSWFAIGFYWRRRNSRRMISPLVETPSASTEPNLEAHSRAKAGDE